MSLWESASPNDGAVTLADQSWNIFKPFCKRLSINGPEVEPASAFQNQVASKIAPDVNGELVGRIPRHPISTFFRWPGLPSSAEACLVGQDGSRSQPSMLDGCFLQRWSQWLHSLYIPCLVCCKIGGSSVGDVNWAQVSS